MTNIYEQHRAAFANVSAFVIVKDSERVATVVFKYPRDGAGRLWAYVHWFGMPMVRGYASRYGYDKSSAAVCATSRKLAEDYRKGVLTERAELRGLPEFLAELVKDDGHYWHNRLEGAGFQVWQAV